MGKHTVIYASRAMSGVQVKEVSGKVRELLTAGRELEANILMLRYAGKRSNQLTRKEAE